MKKDKITSEEFDSTSNVNKDKKTKNKSNAQKAMPWLIVAIISLLIILTCTLIAYYQVYSSNKQNANILEGVYASSYYSMVDNMNNLAVDVSKYSNLNTKNSKLKTLSDIRQDCNYIVAGLSVLPINEENVISATKFFNQVDGVCEAYAKTLNTRNLTQEEELIFDKISIVLGEIKQNFNEQNFGMYDTSYNFIDASIFDDSGMNELSNGMGDLSSSNIEYPAMIFDGPFSSALETAVVKGLPKEECTKEQAKDYLQNTVYAGRKNVEIEFARTTEGDIDTYDFEVKIENKDFNVQVSKRGCLLITISSYAEGGDPIINKEQASEMAKTFANNIGFDSMDYVWQEVNENVAYINLAPIKNKIIYYPDLVKVKVDLTSQEIIGFEAVNYAFNHVDRDMEFLFSQAEAEKVLGFDYEILETNKTIIKLDSGKEISAYEFILERIDGNYFYYIDANNGEIAKVMKLVKVKDVEKLI